MPEHVLQSPRPTVVRAPAQGEVLTGNMQGAWEPQPLGAYAGSFGTPAAISSALTTLTLIAPGTPDYAIQDVINTNAYGFADAEEARTVLSVIRNLQVRLAEVETKLRALGIAT